MSPSKLRLIVLFVFALFAASVAAAEVHEDPLERQTMDIAKDLRCAVCQNEPVSDSQADLARDMRHEIRDQLRQGKSRAQIIKYFTDRYGDYILLKPPFDYFGAMLWILPPLLIVIVGAFGFAVIRARARRKPDEVPALSPDDRARIEAARGAGQVQR